MSEDPAPYVFDEIISRSEPVGQIMRPIRGWIHAMRGAQKLTLSSLARRLKVTPPAVRSFEQAEADDRITLGSLRRTAGAMGCDLIYALVPRSGTAETLAAAKNTAAGHRPPATAPSDVAASDASDSASKVTDKTWHALHGDP